jgi:hypothetical protein
MGESITSYIEDLFRYINDYESSYASFQIEGFFQTYNGIGAVFQALREQRDKAVEVDRVFIDKIKQRPLNSSDLRQLTIQILISFFESVADTDGQSGNSYIYCRELRNVRQDVPYFETVLMPLLVREGSLNNNFKLNHFFLKEIGRYIRKFSRGFSADVNFEDFKGMPIHQKLLTLSLRRSELGEDIINDRDSLEFHMSNVGIFEKLRQESPLAESYLKEWSYLAQSPSFLDRLKQFFAVVGAKLRGSFSSSNYVRLSLSQRYAAYVFYWLMIVVFVFLAVFVPLRWNKYTEKRLEDFKSHVEETEKDMGR